MSTKTRLLLVLGLCLLVVGLGATKVPAAEKVFKLGVLGPFTGPAAKSGNEFKNAARMAMEEINYQIGDYKVELVYIDDQSDPAKGTSAYAEAIERKGVQAGILNWNTAVTVAIQEMLAKYQVPHFFCEGAGKAGVDKWQSLPPEKRYLIMKGWPIPQKLVEGYAIAIEDAIKKGLWKPKKKLAALWGEDTDWGRSIVGGLREQFSKRGWQIYTEEYFALTKTDFYPFVNKCRKAGVTGLFGSSSGVASVSAIIKQAREVGFRGLIIADGLGWVGEWYKMTGAASNGVLDMQPLIATAEQKAWADKFKTKFGYYPSPSAAGQGYDYTRFFIKIAKRAIAKYGRLDSDTITKVGREEMWPGKLRFTQADGALFHASYGTDPESVPDPTVGPGHFFFPVVQYKNGKGYVIYPDYMKQADLMVR